MKKLICLLLTMLMISGCSGQKDNISYMLLSSNGTYNLYNQSGDELTSDNYSDYQEINNGYIVTSINNEMSYIGSNGDTIIEKNKYTNLIFNDQMVVAYNVDKEDESISNVTVYNSEGEELYKDGTSTSIKVSGLPVINEGNEWIVLYQNGEELYRGSEEVSYALSDDDVYVIAFKNYFNVYYDDESEQQILKVKETGQFKLSDRNNNELLLYDEETNKLVYLNLETSITTIHEDISADDIYFDHGNIVSVKDNKLSLLSKTSTTAIIMNSYYHSIDYYVLRNNAVYGPHSLYVDQELAGEIKDCEVNPLPTYITGELYPVYLEDKGYTYYNNEGKQAFDSLFKEANLYDENNLAIVKDEDDQVFIIDEEGNQVSEGKFFDIKYIGSSYYAVYNDKGEIGVIDKTGTVIFDIGFTYISDDPFFHYNDTYYMVIEKNGVSYLYDVSDFSEVFSIEGKMNYNDEEGYIIGDSFHYYTLEGEAIK